MTSSSFKRGGWVGVEELGGLQNSHTWTLGLFLLFFSVLIIGVSLALLFYFKSGTHKGLWSIKGLEKGEGERRGCKSNCGGSACLVAGVSPRAEYLRWSQGEVRRAEIMLALFLLLSRTPRPPPAPSSTIPTGGA